MDIITMLLSIFDTTPPFWIRLGLYASCSSLLIVGLILLAFPDRPGPLDKSGARILLLVILGGFVLIWLGLQFGVRFYIGAVVISAVSALIVPLVMKAFFSDEKIRVKLAGGQTGTVNEKDFDPNTMERL